MRRQGAGRIVTIGSVAGFVAIPYEGVYVAAKYALEGWVETLAYEVRASAGRRIVPKVRHPRLARSSAVARPIPLETPVTRATFCWALSMLLLQNPPPLAADCSLAFTWETSRKA